MKSHVVAVIEGHELYLRTRNGRFDLHWVDPFGGETEEQVGDDKIVAPLPGTVVALLAEEGATLEKGAAILTLEVMKMEQTLRAPFAGVLKKIKCKVGDIVGEGVELAEIEPAPREASMSDRVRIVEVGPRDGLQNEKTPVSVADRIAFIEALIGAGLAHRRGRRLRVAEGDPADGRTRTRCCAASDHHPDSEFHVLVPNEKGYEASQAAGAKVIAVFASASEGFSRANINCTIAESIERFKPVLARAKADGVKVRGYISCVLGCPYEGEVKPQAVVDVARTLWELGCYEVSLGDTIGVGTPLKARQSAARGGRQRADGQSRDAFPRHLRPGAGQSLCRDGRGLPRDRFRRRRPRRLPLRARRDRQRRHRGRGLHARRHGHRDRRRHGRSCWRRPMRSAG